MVTQSILLLELPYPTIILITAIVIIFYFWTQHKQKMELIKNGESLIQLDSIEKMKIGNLAKGIIAISLSLGIFIAHILEKNSELNPFVLYTSMLLLFFGLGSIFFYFIVRNK